MSALRLSAFLPAILLIASCNTWQLDLRAPRETVTRQYLDRENGVPTPFLLAQPYLTVYAMAAPQAGSSFCAGNAVAEILESRSQQAAVTMVLASGNSQVNVPLVALSSATTPVTCSAAFNARYIFARSVMSSEPGNFQTFPVRVSNEISSASRLEGWFEAATALSGALAPASGPAAVAPIAVIATSQLASQVVREGERLSSGAFSTDYPILTVEVAQDTRNDRNLDYALFLQPLDSDRRPVGTPQPLGNITLNLRWARSVLATQRTPSGLRFPGRLDINQQLLVFRSPAAGPETLTLGQVIDAPRPGVLSDIRALTPQSSEDQVSAACTHARNALRLVFNEIDQTAAIWAALRPSALGRTPGPLRDLCIGAEDIAALRAMGSG